MTQWLRTVVLAEGSGCSSQHTRGSYQPSITPVPGALMPPSELCGHQVPVVHRYIHASKTVIHTKINTSKNVYRTKIKCTKVASLDRADAAGQGPPLWTAEMVKLNSSAGRLGLLDLGLLEGKVMVFSHLCKVVILKKLTIEV